MTVATQTALLEKAQEIVSQLQEGEFVAGMEKHYADDVVNVESTGVRTEGKDLLIANEKEFLAKVETFHGVDVRGVGVGEDDGQGNGVTFAEYSIQVDLKDGSKFNPEQVQVTRWRDGKAIENRFYYNPTF